MRTTDCFTMIFEVFIQQKVRTLLTLAGVIIGSCLLIISLSIKEGLHDGVLKHFSADDQLRLIRIGPQYGRDEGNVKKVQITGEINETRRERLRKKLAEKQSDARYRLIVPLSAEKLDTIAALNHVESVVPEIDFFCHNFFGEHSERGFVQGMLPDDMRFQPRIVAGKIFSSDNVRKILVHEYLAYKWGFVDDGDVKNVIGKTVKLELRSRTRILANLATFNTGDRKELSLKEIQKLQAAAKKLENFVKQLKLPEDEKELLLKLFKAPQPVAEENNDENQMEDLIEEFTIVGVFRDLTEEEERQLPYFNASPRNVDFVLPLLTAREVALKLPHHRGFDFDHAIVTVDKEENLKEVTEEIRNMDLDEYSMWRIVENIRKNVALIMYSMSVLAAMAIFVAALGITNTMAMSVLERTHDIGVMKAIGARDGQIQMIFLLEGAVIGLLGGGLGLLAGWLAKFPGDAIARSIIEKEFHGAYEQSIFAYPLWMTLSVPLFAAAVTMLASYYPARRAAKIDPIEALRHE